MSELFKQVTIDGVEYLQVDEFSYNVAISIRGAETLDEAAQMVRNVLNNARQQLAQQSSDHIGDVDKMINPSVDVLVDAERYRWLRGKYVMANFDIYGAEKFEDGVSGIIFEMPDGISYSADIDAVIDEAMNEAKTNPQ